MRDRGQQSAASSNCNQPATVGTRSARNSQRIFLLSFVLSVPAAGSCNNKPKNSMIFKSKEMMQLYLCLTKSTNNNHNVHAWQCMFHTSYMLCSMHSCTIISGLISTSLVKMFIVKSFCPLKCTINLIIIEKLSYMYTTIVEYTATPTQLVVVLLLLVENNTYLHVHTHNNM